MDETGVMLSTLGSVKALIGKDDPRLHRRGSQTNNGNCDWMYIRNRWIFVTDDNLAS